jgi:hypothetical protein
MMPLVLAAAKRNPRFTGTSSIDGNGWMQHWPTPLSDEREKKKNRSWSLSTMLLSPASRDQMLSTQV